jgi:hypothetical protein
VSDVSGEPDGWLRRLPLEDQQRFAALFLRLIETQRRTKDDAVVANLEIKIVDAMDKAQAAGFLRAQAAHMRQGAASWIQMAEIQEHMADIITND